MDLVSPTPTTNSPLTPVFGDNVQDLLNAGALNVNPTGIIVVNSIADQVDDSESGVTTLRDAINQANANDGEDLIVFDRSLFSTAQSITLSLGELDITNNVDIIAPRDPLTGGNLLTVSGNKAERVFEIEFGSTVNLNGLIVADGLVMDDNGAGIKNSGTLTLDNSIVRNNTEYLTSLVPSGGGAIYNTGTLTVNNSDASDNSITSDNIITTNGNLTSTANPIGYGGGIYNIGVLTVNNSTLSGNAPTIFDGCRGGGIYNSGVLSVNNSTLSGNAANGFLSDSGGGIYNTDTGILTVSNSTLSGNKVGSRIGGSGGGIYNDHGTVTVSNSTLSGNSSAFLGGGGGIFNSGNLTVSDSTLSSNTATRGGGIENSGSLTVSDSTLSKNGAGEVGGGIDSGGTLTVNNSTLSGNSATINGGGISNNGVSTVNNSTLSNNSAGSNFSGNNGSGGGIDNGGTLTVNNSTLSGNSATINGGGIYNGSTLTLVFSTLTLNQATNGGGVYNYPGTSSLLPRSPKVRNTIIALNLNSTGGINPDVSGIFTSNGYNLIGDSTGSTGFGATGDIVGTSDNPIDPRLAPLDFNSGTTQTIALLPDSPAIDAGDPTVLDTDPTTDQRGLARVSNGRADIGAFEVQV